MIVYEIIRYYADIRADGKPAAKTCMFHPTYNTMPLLNRPPTPHPAFSSHREFTFPTIPKTSLCRLRLRSDKNPIPRYFSSRDVHPKRQEKGLHTRSKIAKIMSEKMSEAQIGRRRSRIINKAALVDATGSRS